MGKTREEVSKQLPPGHGVTFFVQGREVRHLGIVDEISDQGMGISVEVRIEPGTILEIVLEEDESETYLLGEVIRCETDPWLEGTFHLEVDTRIKIVT